MIKKILLITVSSVVVFSPLLYTLFNAEYDGEQFFTIQNFENGQYEIISTQNNSIVYKIFVKENNWTGFDIPFLGDISQSSIVSILNENKEHVRIGKIKYNLLINKEQIINVRFQRISGSEGKYYYIVFTRGNNNAWKLQYSLDNIYRTNELFIDGKKVDGDLNIVNVYKENIAGMLVILKDRFLYYLRS